ncbi:hypothetical protein BG006_002137 [Podila minutissima]|uniref:DUF3020 domain-containing protein n=1 Tax=Podila minutissima TaxID=64525 RepID=A0A9P5S9J2_9FUNG|nr:hypothetical protein BG006_002137 [Podila minutissima]
MSEAPVKAPKGEPKDTSTINKIRTENRERKKRWREANEDRNKDNDLRCRVSKRANKLHGKEPSEEKTRWMEEEFEKRQNKRKDKERRRNPNATGDSLPLNSTTPSTSSSSSTSKSRASARLNQQLQQQQQADQLAAALGIVGGDASHVLASSSTAAGGSLSTLGLSGQFDPNTVKTALALSDFVKKNVSLDLAQLTHVLADPNLAQQLLELERASAATVAAVTSATAASPPTTATTTTTEASTVPTLAGSSSSSSASMSSLAASLPGLLLSTLKTAGGDPVKALAAPAFNQAMDTDYPMDAVLTLMQLNGGWKA